MRTRYFLRAGALMAALAVFGCGSQAVPKGDYGTVSGHVKSSSGQPISGATVTIDSVLTATTASDGSYSVGTVPADSADTNTMVQAAAHGFTCPTQSTKVTSQASSTVDFICSPG